MLRGAQEPAHGFPLIQLDSISLRVAQAQRILGSGIALLGHLTKLLERRSFYAWSSSGVLPGSVRRCENGWQLRHARAGVEFALDPRLCLRLDQRSKMIAEGQRDRSGRQCE